MSETLLPESLLVDDYVMNTLERICEGRIRFADYVEELSDIKSDFSAHGIPTAYKGTEYIEGQTANAEANEMISEIFFLENELIRHLERLLAMPQVVPLRQLEWHLELSAADLSQIMTQASKTPPLSGNSSETLDFDELLDYVEDDGKIITFGYPPALLLEALYWPQRAAHHSK